MLKGRKRATLLRQMPSRVKGKLLDEEAPAEEAPAEDAGAEVAGNATVLCCCHCLYVSHLACVYLSLCLSVCLSLFSVYAACEEGEAAALAGRVDFSLGVLVRGCAHSLMILHTTRTVDIAIGCLWGVFRLNGVCGVCVV